MTVAKGRHECANIVSVEIHGGSDIFGSAAYSVFFIKRGTSNINFHIIDCKKESRKSPDPLLTMGLEIICSASSSCFSDATVMVLHGILWKNSDYTSDLCLGKLKLYLGRSESEISAAACKNCKYTSLLASDKLYPSFRAE